MDQGVQRIRIILCSVKLRVLNPKLQKQRYIREIKKNDTSQTKHANIIENVCFFSRASGRFATQEGTRFHIVVVSVGFGRRVVVGVRWMMMGFFFFPVCCSRFAIVYHHHHLPSSSSSSSACGDREKLYPF